MNAMEQSKRTILIPTKSDIAKNPWITAALLNSCKKKHCLYKKMCKGLISINEYHTYKNKLTKLICLHKKQYYKEICH